MVCDLCQKPIKKVWHAWTIRGELKSACPSCHGVLERRASAAAVKTAVDGKPANTELVYGGVKEFNSTAGCGCGCLVMIGLAILAYFIFR